MQYKDKNVNDQAQTPATPGPVQRNVDLLSSPSTSKAEAMEILTSPDRMADLFRSRLSRIFPDGAVLKECQPKILKGRQYARQVLSYRLIFSDLSVRKTKSLTLVAKRFADKKKGRREYLAMRTLWESGFDHRSNLRIPRPFFFLEDLNLLIQEMAHGTLLNKNLSRSSPFVIAGLRSAARWLVKLHHIDSDFERIDPYPDDETEIKKCVERIGDKEPKLLSQVEKLNSSIKARLSSLRGVRFTLAHGDFQCENIFVDREKVTVIDFGRFCKSDPARDLGCMIAQARATGFLKTGSFTSLLPGLNAFWEEYLNGTSPKQRESFSERTCMFAAIKYLENINYIFSYSPEKGKEVWQSLLDDAEKFGKAQRIEEVFRSL